ncbi:MAG TPA: GNAT family N-acetyltransferase [Firmicutes bacterium]|jgi:RimJ/RimL family protein N-acetyltransferase|nr:GNAT family N-acetyltransferase [Bacillota bacterium]
MMISGEKVIIRSLEATDLSKIVTWTLDEEVNRFLESDYPKNLSDCVAWLQEVQSNRLAQHFAITTVDNQLIGDIELDHISWRSGDAELRIRIGEKSLWDKGYGTDAVLTLIDYAFTRMSLKRIYLRVYAANRRAVRCYEKAGFRKEGRLRRRSQAGDMEEVYLMRILRDEYLHSPQRQTA